MIHEARAWKALCLLACFVGFATSAWMLWIAERQHQVINELIELNYDKSLYIDSGCHGRYQGTEETTGRE
jgi:hypothetical protein